MTVVGDRLVRPGGGSVVAAPILVELKWDERLAGEPSSEEFQVSRRQSTLTDGNGNWSMDLIPNEDIAPAGSVYKVSYKPSRYSGLRVFIYIEVPAEGATPTDLYVGDLQVA